MKIKVKAFLHYDQNKWLGESNYELWPVKMEDSDTRTFIGQHEFEVEVPDDFDPRPAQIAALEAQKKKVMADFQRTVDQINTRISKLKALEHTA